VARAEWMRAELDADDDGTVSDEEVDAVLGDAGDESEPGAPAAPLTREAFTPALFDRAKARFPVRAVLWRVCL
jgi:hypothetical protein